MDHAQTVDSTLPRRLRLWPGVVIVLLQLLARFAVPVIAPDAAAFAPLSGPVGALAVIVWWAFLSRAPWTERVGAVLLMIVALAATPYILHESIRTGNMGIQFFIYAPAVLSLAFVVWAVAARNLSERPRRAAMVATILLACGAWALLRSDGLSGEGAPDFTWRWAETAEERLLARADDVPRARSVALAAAETRAERVATDWLGYRGPDRDGSVPGVPIATDWSASPPLELWRRKVGPVVAVGLERIRLDMSPAGATNPTPAATGFPEAPSLGLRQDKLLFLRSLAPPCERRAPPFRLSAPRCGRR